jgi:hypothetical protein
MKPGLWLQMLTTKPPTPDMIEVAIRSLEQVLPPAERAQVASLPSPLVAGTGAEVGNQVGENLAEDLAGPEDLPEGLPKGG